MKKNRAIAAPACDPLDMDPFTLAQYEWGCGLPRGAHIRRVANAGDEDVRSVTLRRAGSPSDLIPPRKSVDNRGTWS
jgi:hypothetical protein